MSGSNPNYIPEPRYVMYRSNALNGFMVVDCAGDYRGCPSSAGDLLRTRAAAEYALRQLNNGRATIDQHAAIGCRIVAS